LISIRNHRTVIDVVIDIVTVVVAITNVTKRITIDIRLINIT